MALLPLDAPPAAKADARASGEVHQSRFDTEAAFLLACHQEAEKIGRCVALPHLTTFEFDPRRPGVCRITVEANQAHAR